MAPGGHAALVTNHGDDTASMIDVARQMVIGTVALPNGPRGVAFAPVGNQGYVVNSYANNIAAIEPMGRRVFIGSKTLDQGFDPPFGVQKAGAILVNSLEGIIHCVMLDAQPPESLEVQWTKGGSYGILAVAQVTADQITKIWAAQGPGEDPQKWVGGAEAVFPQTTFTQVLLQFESYTGQLVSVMPVRSRFPREDGSRAGSLLFDGGIGPHRRFFSETP